MIEALTLRMEFEMTVKNGDFIKIDYTESVDDQVILTTNKELAIAKGIYDEETRYEPRLIIVGSGQIAQGFEEDLIGKEIGYEGRVVVPPEKAFGRRDPKKVETVPITRFKEEKPVVGMRVGMDNKYGVVTRVIGRKVSIDFNHPLAEKTIVYDYKILEGIEDRLEKLKSMVKTFARMDLEAELKDDVAVITVPWELSYYKEWLMIRRGLADMIIQHLSLKEVDFVEKHTGEKVKAELISPPGKELGAEPQTELEDKPQAEAKVEAKTGGEGLGSEESTPA
ncbi:MAG: peptidylprolyl isomerase [Methanotrichaceae archaeon]|nr:peptidylprolyl isomerase [Methanotrichaceae archaeon]